MNPGPLSPDSLCDLLFQLPVHYALTELSPRQRRALGGHLLSIGPRLSQLIAQALDRYPHLFADIPFGASELRARSERLRKLKRLRTALACLESAVNDTCIREEAELNKLCLSVLRHAEHAEAMPFADVELVRDCECALALARQALCKHYGSARKGRQPAKSTRGRPWRSETRKVQQIIHAPPPALPGRRKMRRLPAHRCVQTLRIHSLHRLR